LEFLDGREMPPLQKLLLGDTGIVRFLGFW
jgi:hypothetical protein